MKYEKRGEQFMTTTKPLNYNRKLCSKSKGLPWALFRAYEQHHITSLPNFVASLLVLYSCLVCFYSPDPRAKLLQ